METVARRIAAVNTLGYGDGMKMNTSPVEVPSEPKPKRSKAVGSLTRKDWERGGLMQLARDGIDKVSVAPLARELGVTKGSFYWHFKDRQALLDAMLVRWQNANTGQFVARVEAHSEDPIERLQAIIHMSINQIGGKLEPALRDWGRRDEKVWKIIRQVDAQRMDFLYRLFGDICDSKEDAVARSWLMYSLLSGIHLVAAEPPGFNRDEMQLRCLEVLTTKS